MSVLTVGSGERVVKSGGVESFGAAWRQRSQAHHRGSEVNRASRIQTPPEPTPRVLCYLRLLCGDISVGSLPSVISPAVIECRHNALAHRRRGFECLFLRRRFRNIRAAAG
jgi:hypothetical protein